MCCDLQQSSLSMRQRCSVVGLLCRLYKAVRKCSATLHFSVCRPTMVVSFRRQRRDGEREKRAVSSRGRYSTDDASHMVCVAVGESGHAVDRTSSDTGGSATQEWSGGIPS